jgi:SAM-dependent methyltransferase
LIAGIGAGTEATVFALARRGALVFAVDRYLERTAWSDTAPAGMLIDPTRYASFDMPRGHVIPVHSNALYLGLPSDAFDGVFCSGLLEHLGSLDDVARAAGELGRILKPGGVATIATTLRLDGPPDRAGFADDLILFTAETLERYVVAASGLVLREPIAFEQSAPTFQSRHHHVEFAAHAHLAHALAEKRAVQPNLVLYHEGFLFCAVALTLHKDRAFTNVASKEQPHVVEAEIAARNAELAASLERFQRMMDEGNVPPESHLLFGEVERLRVENDELRAALDRANAWKHWRVLRPARFVYRRIKRRSRGA